ncbi:MAG: 3-keto-5-aminohexanoate cleavage protein [Actinomycetota bacterium]|nr:3-keto-5-aminohexanoate cleavage protein [Actinomycetota bacterium]
MGDKVVVTCAVTGGMTVPSQSKAIPVSPAEIIDDAVAAHEAGAAIIHIHVRDPQTGRPVADLHLFEEVLEGISARCDAVLQPTTGGGVGMSIEERAAVLERFQPEMATFNAGSFNFGIFPVGERDLELADWERDYVEGTRDYVFRNTFANMEYMAGRMRAARAKPEIELYDVGHLYNLRHLVARDLLDTPLHLQFVLGVLGANDAELDQLVHMLRTAQRLLGDDFTWSSAGVGYPGEFHLVAASLMLGGQVRVGLEDNLRVRRDARARSNVDLVDKAVELARLFDREPATPDEARKLLGLKGAGAVGF